MKKLISAMIVAFLFAACEKTSIEPQDELVLKKGSKKEKVKLCHRTDNGVTL